MRFIITGIGSIGRRHFQNLYALGFRNIMVARSTDKTDAPQAEFLKKFQPQVFYDLDDALAIKPDVVMVTNPTSLHVATALKAIKSGAHVFIEKPLSHDWHGVDELFMEAKKRKKIIYIGYHFRHHPQLQYIKRYLVSGKLGAIFSAHFTTGEYLPLWHPWENYRKGYSARKDLGGGVTLTQSHDLDVAFWLFGKPKQVFANVSNSGALNIDVDDTADMFFQCTRCPVVTIHLDYLARPPIKHYRIIGTKGRVEWDYHTGELTIFSLTGSVKKIPLPKGFERNAMYRDEVIEFIDYIKKVHTAVLDGGGGREVLRMVIQAKESSRLQQKITF